MAAVMNAIRAQFSQGRNRFQQDSFDLDLSYVTPFVIAMGYPASGVEAAYRNNIDDVARMLDQYHRNNYLVLNLSGRPYDYTKFHNSVVELGWADHHAPPLEKLFFLCRCMHSWLQEEKHVVVVHCVAGKGRTGVVVTAYLLYSGFFRTTLEALDFFANRRGSGITYPCQKRYIEYLFRVLQGFMPNPKPVTLHRILLTGLPNVGGTGRCAPFVNIYVGADIESERPTFTTRARVRNYDAVVTRFVVIDLDATLQGDVLLRLYHLPNAGSEQFLCRLQFHTGFIERGDVLATRFSRAHIDEASKLTAPSNFALDLFMRDATPAEAERVPPRPAFPWAKEREEYLSRCQEHDRLHVARLEALREEIKKEPPLAPAPQRPLQPQARQSPHSFTPQPSLLRNAEPAPATFVGSSLLLNGGAAPASEFAPPAAAARAHAPASAGAKQRSATLSDAQDAAPPPPAAGRSALSAALKGPSQEEEVVRAVNMGDVRIVPDVIHEGPLRPAGAVAEGDDEFDESSDDEVAVEQSFGSAGPPGYSGRE